MDFQSRDNVSIGDIPLFENLSLKEIRSLKKHLKPRTYRRGEMVFTEGDDCKEILIIVSGRLKVFRTSSEGREQILEVLESGDTCACNPGTVHWSCSASAQALTSCRTWSLPRSHYKKLVASNHKLAQSLNRIFAERLCKFCSLIEGVALDTPTRRLAKFLLDIMNDQNHKVSADKHTEIVFTHEEIAQRIGLVRETVTRHLHKFKKQGLIDIQSHRILVLDKKGLETLLR